MFFQPDTLIAFGLVLNIFGSYFLAYSVMIGSRPTAAAGHAAPTAADERARKFSNARVGMTLLILGFLVQLIVHRAF